MCLCKYGNYGLFASCVSYVTLRTSDRSATRSTSNVLANFFRSTYHLSVFAFVYIQTVPAVVAQFVSFGTSTFVASQSIQTFTYTKSAMWVTTLVEVNARPMKNPIFSLYKFWYIKYAHTYYHFAGGILCGKRNDMIPMCWCTCDGKVLYLRSVHIRLYPYTFVENLVIEWSHLCNHSGKILLCLCMLRIGSKPEIWSYSSIQSFKSKRPL